MCQKCTAPGPATGSLYLTISQTVLSAEREKGRNRERVCTHKCSSYSEGQRPHTLCTHTTHNRTHRVLFDRLVLLHFAFICFNRFGNKRSHGSSAKRCHLGAILCRTSASTPPSAWAISGFVDCLTNCQQQRRRRRLWSKLFALQTSVRIRVRFPLLVIVVFAHLLPPSLSLVLLLLCCQALTSDARFPRHR